MTTRRPWMWAAAWIAAVAVAVSIGAVTVTLLASSMKDRGVIGAAMVEETSAGVAAPPGSAQASPTAAATPLRTDVFSGEFGTFEVGCAGVRASTVSVRPASGWREVSHESGPDDDVDAVFTDGAREVEVTVFCNRGTPTLDEIEFDTLGAE